MTDTPPPYEKLVLGFGGALAAIAYVYWTVLGFDRGDAWTTMAASRALFILGASLLLAVVMRLALQLNHREP